MKIKLLKQYKPEVLDEITKMVEQSALRIVTAQESIREIVDNLKSGRVNNLHLFYFMIRDADNALASALNEIVQWPDEDTDAN